MNRFSSVLQSARTAIDRPCVLLAGLVVVALNASPAAPQEAAIPSEPEAVVIESMTPTNEPASAVLALAMSRRGRWLAGSRADGLITITLENTIPNPGVTNVVEADGHVASVEILLDKTTETPAAKVRIRTRSRSSYSVAATEGWLFVRIRSSSGGPPIPLAVPPTDDATPPIRTPPPPAAAPFTAPTESANGEYRIGAGDVLQVEVFGLPELTRETRVLRDGSITLPLVGGIKLAGLGLRQAELGIADLLSKRKLVNDPQVSILVKDFQSRGISIQGAVNRPGVYQMVESKSLLEMIGQAGGLVTGDRAGTSIIILRNRADSEERIEIDALRLVEQGDQSLNLALLPDDIVMVPPPRVFRVFISGAVRNTGTVDFSSTEPFTVFQAITAAGGPTERANLRKVTVIRRRPDGSQDRIEVNLKKVRKGSQEDLLLEDGDTIIVGEWFF